MSTWILSLCWCATKTTSLGSGSSSRVGGWSGNMTCVGARECVAAQTRDRYARRHAWDIIDATILPVSIERGRTLGDVLDLVAKHEQGSVRGFPCPRKDLGCGHRPHGHLNHSPRRMGRHRPSLRLESSRCGAVPSSSHAAWITVASLATELAAGDAAAAGSTCSRRSRYRRPSLASAKQGRLGLPPRVRRSCRALRPFLSSLVEEGTRPLTADTFAHLS